jgi:hypothetical protein
MTFADFWDAFAPWRSFYALRLNYCGRVSKRRGGRAHDCHDDEWHPA